MKTDMQLQRDVLDQLEYEPSIQESEIGTAVKDGVVTLSGSVSSYAQKYSAIRVAEHVSGVRAVVDQLTVTLPAHHVLSDTEIAHSVVNALGWDVRVPDRHIKTTVRDGWITLEGDVEWQYQRSAAERAVRNLQGVKGVSNLIAVKPNLASAADVGEKIRSTLRRTADLDASRIRVETRDGTVTLTGAVRSFAERQDAERAAWSAPGVTQVDDRITVTI